MTLHENKGAKVSKECNKFQRNAVSLKGKQ